MLQSYEAVLTSYSIGGRGGFQSYGPPDTVLEMGKFMHPCEGDIVCESINPKIPYFNAPIFLENKVGASLHYPQPEGLGQLEQAS